MQQHPCVLKSVLIALSLTSLSFWQPIPLFSQIKFTEVTDTAGIDHHYLGVNLMGGGAAFFDMDNDGDEDLWLSGGLNRDALYENDGTGHFTEIGEQAGLWATSNRVTTGVITGDMDNDGFKDVLIITHIGFGNFFMKNNGDKTFLPVYSPSMEAADVYSLAAAMADIDQDGFLDVYAGHYIKKNHLDYSSENPDSVVGFSHECYANTLHMNDGNWGFTDVSDAWQAADAGCALATVFTDYDGDFDSDLLVVNDFGQWILPNALLENNQSSFLNVSPSTQMDIGLYGMGIAVGDYDHDLDLDYYITNLGENVLLKNNGNGTFTNSTTEAGVEDSHVTEDLLATGWGTAFVDFDNDSDLDLYVVNGYVPAAPFIANAEANPNRCFENDGKGYFTSVLNETAVESPMRGRGLAYADIDNDGDVDLLVGNVNRQATSDTIQRVQLFRNDSANDHNWLKIRLEGTQNNRDGIGSQVRIKAGDRWFMQEANGGYGTHASQHSQIIHFGLGTTPIVDSLIVFWPGGASQVLTEIRAKQTITIEEGQMTVHAGQVSEEAFAFQIFPNPFSGSATIRYQLPESMPVAIDVFDQLGRKIYQLPQARKPPGRHSLEWQPPTRGWYLIRLNINEVVYTKKAFAL